MKINNVGPSKVINIYNNKKVEIKKNVEAKKDSLEISEAAKNLRNFINDKNYEASPEKIEALRNEIANGTYKPNAKLTAQKILDNIKGREV